MEELQLTKKEYNVFIENIDSYIVELSDKITQVGRRIIGL